MGYVLLWIESLAASLLFVATLVACIGRLRRPWVRSVLVVLAALVPLAIYGLAAGAAAVVRFAASVSVGAFYPVLALLICYLGGAVWIRIAGMRRGDDSPLVAAAAWPRGKLAVALGAVLALHLITFWNLDLAIRQRLSGLQAESAALALSVAPARLPDRDNAAPVYQQVFEALGPQHTWPEARREQWDKWTDIEHGKLDPKDPELAAFLREQAPALALLREAAKKPGCHFDRDYGRPSIDMLLPELSELRNAARLLSLDARCLAAQGDFAGTTDDVNAIFAMAEHLGSDPILISGLVAMAIDRIGCETLQAVLRFGPVPKEALESVDIDARLSFQRLCRRSLRMEEAFALNVFQQIGNGSLEIFAALSTPEQASMVPRMGQAPQWLYRLFLLTDDVASYRSAMTEFSQLAAKPYYEAKPDFDSFGRKFAAEPHGIITRLMMPALSRVAETAAQADARHSAARLALALARYRAEHGRLPGSLNELVPQRIAVVPRDPFDGRPMRLKQTDKAAIIYAIGPDLKDDGGAPFDHEMKTGDVSFEIPR
jgi:hypothetical protein